MAQSVDACHREAILVGERAKYRYQEEFAANVQSIRESLAINPIAARDIRDPQEAARKADAQYEAWLKQRQARAEQDREQAINEHKKAWTILVGSPTKLLPRLSQKWNVETIIAKLQGRLNSDCRRLADKHIGMPWGDDGRLFVRRCCFVDPYAFIELPVSSGPSVGIDDNPEFIDELTELVERLIVENEYLGWLNDGLREGKDYTADWIEQASALAVASGDPPTEVMQSSEEDLSEKIAAYRRRANRIRNGFARRFVVEIGPRVTLQQLRSCVAKMDNATFGALQIAAYGGQPPPKYLGKKFERNILWWRLRRSGLTAAAVLGGTGDEVETENVYQIEKEIRDALNGRN